MAQDIEVFSDPAIAHRETCMLHENERLGLCSGTLKRGGNCVNKATGSLLPQMIPRWMPTCRIHQGQQKKTGCCQALLDCGFECGQLFEWKPHGFHLCSHHINRRKTCYFLEAPTEVRLRIYRFILPDQTIPAHYDDSRLLKTDHSRVCMAILRVNHQIHDEAASLLYGTGAFTIQLLGNHWTMCNTTVHNPYDSKGCNPYDPISHNSSAQYSHGSAHALEDYQLELLLLEQQNKKRLMLARYEQDSINGGPSLSLQRNVYRFQQGAFPTVVQPRGPSEPVWRPLLTAGYFDMIRFFHIEIKFPYSKYAISGVQTSSNTAAHESTLYNYCDHLHGLIGRLRLIPNPIAHIEVTFEFENMFTIEDEAFLAVELLLKPFRRLSNVTKTEIRSITWRNMQGPPIELLSTDPILKTSKRAFVEFLKGLSEDLSGSQLLHGYLHLFDAYWQLENLMDDIKKHCHYMCPHFNQFKDLLHTARIARESNDLASFEDVWEKVVNIWLDYLNNQKEFQSDMARSIKAVYDTIGRDSMNE